MRAKEKPNVESELFDHDGLTTTMKVLQAKEILEELAKDEPMGHRQQSRKRRGGWLRRLFGRFRRA